GKLCAGRQRRPAPALARASSRHRGPRRRRTSGHDAAEAVATPRLPACGRLARRRPRRIGWSGPMARAAAARGSARDRGGRGEATFLLLRSAQGNLNAERSSLSRWPELCYELSSQLMKAIGTPVACPACHHPNPGINIWCERCRRPLDWNPATRVTSDGIALLRRRYAFDFPRLTVPAVVWPRGQ